MSKIPFLYLLLIFCLDAFSQDPIDFNLKVLYPELQKFSIAKNLEIEKTSAIREIQQPMQSRNSSQGKYFSIFYNSGTNPINYAFMGRVNSCRAGGCSASRNSTENGEHEYFDYFILFDSIPAIRLVKVYNYQATHGQEITSKGWLKQFVGYDASQSLNVGKNIDAISGATISVWGITADLEAKYRGLKEILSSENSASSTLLPASLSP